MRRVAKVQDEGTARLVLCGQSALGFCAVVLSVSLSGPSSDWRQAATAKPTTAPASAVNSGPKPEPSSPLRPGSLRARRRINPGRAIDRYARAALDSPNAFDRDLLKALRRSWFSNLQFISGHPIAG